MSAEGVPCFVDTNVLVYAFEKGGSAKKETAVRLLTGLMDDDRLRLSTQVLQELYVTLTRKVASRCTDKEALAVLDELTSWPLAVIDYPAIRAAAFFQRQFVSLGRGRLVPAGAFLAAVLIVGDGAVPGISRRRQRERHDECGDSGADKRSASHRHHPSRRPRGHVSGPTFALSIGCNRCRAGCICRLCFSDSFRARAALLHRATH